MEEMIVRNFSLEHTLECGQIFRFEKEGKGYYVSHRDKLFYVEQAGPKLKFKNTTKAFLTKFFRLDDPYSKILKSISKDKHIKKAIKEYHGLRIIRQDPWECLISFICSSNSNIPKIKMNLSLMSSFFGKPLKLDSFESHAFPNPGSLTHFGKLKDSKVGYRAEFIREANKNISNKELITIRGKEYEYAKQRLIQIKGVGDKIADCVALFSLDKLNAFPVDVWVQRVMTKLYFEGEERSKQEIAEFGREYFGEYAGYANQFLFYYARQNDKTR